MKWISLHNTISQLRHTINRFPYVAFIALVGTVSAWLLVDASESEETLYYQLMMSSMLGLPLLFSITLYLETNKIRRKNNWLVRTPAFLFLIIYFFTLPDKFNEIVLLKFMLFNVGFHLLVSFVAFTKSGYIQAFWQFNKSLLLRFSLSALYSFALFIGFTIALVAIDNLFGVNVRDAWYVRLFITVSGLFNTLMFLAGVPQNIEDLNGDESYPPQLKAFTQYVLLPLVTLYLVILYLYTFKILIEWNLPKGWVSYLVVSFSIAGILSLLLIHPIRNNEGNNWIKTFARNFYIALFPLIILLFVSIGKRIQDYGVTENRYFVIVLAIWLLAMALYFLLGKSKNIKIIPVTLFIVCFFSSFGPWGAFSIAQKSQVYQLKEMLSQKELLKNGLFVKNTSEEFEANTSDRIKSIVNFLERRNALDELQPLFETNFEEMWASDTTAMSQSQQVLLLFGIENSFYSSGSEKINNTYFNLKPNQAININTYQYSFDINIAEYDSERQLVFEDPDDDIRFVCHTVIAPNKNNLLIFDDKQTLLAEIHLDDFLNSLLKKREDNANYPTYEVPTAELTVLHQSEKVNFKVVFEQIGISKIGTNKVRIINAKAKVLVSFPKTP